MPPPSALRFTLDVLCRGGPMWTPVLPADAMDVGRDHWARRPQGRVPDPPEVICPTPLSSYLLTSFDLRRGGLWPPAHSTRAFFTVEADTPVPLRGIHFLSSSARMFYFGAFRRQRAASPFWSDPKGAKRSPGVCSDGQATSILIWMWPVHSRYTPDPILRESLIRKPRATVPARGSL